MKTDKRGLGKFNDGKDFDEECFGQSNLDGNYKKSQSQRQCCGVYPNRWENTHPVHFRSRLSVPKFESRLNLRYFKATKIWKFGPVRIFSGKGLAKTLRFDWLTAILWILRFPNLQSKFKWTRMFSLIPKVNDVYWKNMPSRAKCQISKVRS